MGKKIDEVEKIIISWYVTCQARLNYQLDEQHQKHLSKFLIEVMLERRGKIREHKWVKSR